MAEVGDNPQRKLHIGIIMDGNGREIFNWAPGGGNVAMGLRVGCEIAGAKLGLERELEKQGIALHERKESQIDKLTELPA